MTSRIYTSSILASKCAWELILFLFLSYCWLLNSTMFLLSYSHDEITSWNDVMTSLNMLYRSQHVEGLGGDSCFLFFCHGFPGCWVQNIIVFIFALCRHVIAWRHDVTDMIIWHPKLALSISVCRCVRKWFFAYLYSCLGSSIKKCHRIRICMMTLCSDVMIMTPRHRFTNLISLI